MVRGPNVPDYDRLSGVLPRVGWVAVGVVCLSGAAYVVVQAVPLLRATTNYGRVSVAVWCAMLLVSAGVAFHRARR